MQEEPEATRRPRLRCGPAISSRRRAGLRASLERFAAELATLDALVSADPSSATSLVAVRARAEGLIVEARMLLSRLGELDDGLGDLDGLAGV